MADAGEAELWERLEGLERRHGAHGLETAAFRHELAGELHAAGRLREAEEQYRRTYEGFARSVGQRHLFTLTCLNNLALVLRDRGRLDESVDLLGAVYQARAQTVGPENPLTLNAANNLVVTLVLQGRLEEAAEQYPALVGACENAFGADHPDVAAIRDDHADVLRRLGRHREAAGLRGTDPVLPIAKVLLSCARQLRYTGMIPVAMSATRYGAELTLGTHHKARVDLGTGRRLLDPEWAVGCDIVGPADVEEPYDPATDGREIADPVADATGALAEHFADAERALGEGRLRVRVFAHHPHRPRLSAPPVLTVDRRLMSRRDQTRHDRLVLAIPGVTVLERRGGLLQGPGFTVRLPGAPDVTVSSIEGIDSRPAPTRTEA
ncbi:tetratricopeptide repeat protein [Streptomyces sp. NPDC004609]|uniref:tetratricopeptide repeat protein n=1 Tax=Streptomyces sp. NPDC004609 TaxID=3364704 RepID=UPI003679AD9B